MIKKKGFYKRLENIKDKNEELLNAFSAANKVSKAARNERDINYDSRYSFCKFCGDFENFKRMVSIDWYQENGINCCAIKTFKQFLENTRYAMN